MKILVADDDRVSLRLMERMLQRSGYAVTIADNGREAAHELLKHDGPRLALIDWMMPELDGLGVCNSVRSKRDNSYVYMLLLTSKESSEDIVKGLQAGADDYLTKPCHPAELQARLHTGRRILELEDKLVEAREGMRFKATHDSLTSLWDRGAILALVRSELLRAIREQTSVSVLLCDIDHFKHINDRYSHLAGDEVLQQVSERLQEAVRPHDAVGRYGGEEFLMVIGNCNADSLRLRAEQVRNSIASKPFRTRQGMIPVTMSVGAITIETWSRSVAIEAMLKDADQALYAAKDAGRNCVVYADNFHGAVATPLEELAV